MALRKNENYNIIEGFATKKLVDVTLAVEWTPDAADVKFRVPAACTYKLNASSNSATLVANAEVVILPGNEFTFDTTMTIEVM